MVELKLFYLKALMNMPKTEFRTILIRQRILCDAHLELNPTLNIQKIGSAQVNFYLQYIHILFYIYRISYNVSAQKYERYKLENTLYRDNVPMALVIKVFW